MVTLFYLVGFHGFVVLWFFWCICGIVVLVRFLVSGFCVVVLWYCGGGWAYGFPWVVCG